MKVVFLDIDGVLNSRRTAIAFEAYGRPGFSDEYYLDPIALKLIEKLCIITKAKIVISSSWRVGASLEELQHVFKDYNVSVIGFTPRIYDHTKVRGDEIQEWLGENEGVTHYVIIDDDSDMLPHHIEKHFVQTNLDLGLTADNYYAAGEILGHTIKELR